jgi:uncharacterized damage-inducible protein DinB
MVNSLKQVFSRDLDTLKKEIESYNKEPDMWLLPEGINNTGGNLCLHLVGNLQHFIGHILGGTKYIRDRKSEFKDSNVLVSSLLKEIETTKKVIEQTLSTITEEQLNANYPIEVFGKPMTTTFFLIHLSGHLMYHLGQINYHRRLLSK